jgi:hypothetical protein
MLPLVDEDGELVHAQRRVAMEAHQNNVQDYAKLKKMLFQSFQLKIQGKVGKFRPTKSNIDFYGATSK